MPLYLPPAPAVLPVLGQNIRTVGGPGSGAQFSDIQAASDSITDSSATKPYTILHIGGTVTVPDVSTGADLGGTSGTNDYINLVGINRDTCIVNRPVSSAGVMSPVIQAVTHGEIANITLTSSVSRLIHWDEVAGAYLYVHDSILTQTGSGAGISTGISGDGSILEVRNNLIQSLSGVHNGTGTGWGNVIVQGNTFLLAAGGAFGIDMTAGSSSIMAYISGNTSKYWSVDPAFIGITLPAVEAGRLIVYTDGGHAFRFNNLGNIARFWNRIIWPEVSHYNASIAVTEGDVVAVDPTQGQYGFSCDKTSTANAPYPAIVTEQLDESYAGGPHLSTGAYAEAICTTGAVVVGDILCTSTTAGQAVTNNAQTDLTKILGWAVMAKGAGSAGRVTVKMNRMINDW